MIRETFAICAAVKEVGSTRGVEGRELGRERRHGRRISGGEGGVWERTYGQIAVLLTVLADFLLGDGHRLQGFR